MGVLSVGCLTSGFPAQDSVQVRSDFVGSARLARVTLGAEFFKQDLSLCRIAHAS